ncbi:TPA: DUF262 domain-containing protein [Vibrio parahaemolyticus]|uniref:DUF262 domain-containing protein n=1 Tax=Vibrio parahaemolyticus TaxID=670 RepID=UPI000A37F791|nr:DUF262 domain-containing protein [Vibrio parahaemolyticus]MCG9643191.1 DUF262 domain-containing protein [Vibrio parahaemolyticus]OUD47595.1 hypothetical protein BS624_04120 [Vibrio parahaemolyticus]
MEYEVSLQTISWLNERRNDGTLEISPKFQRRAVWLESERSELMNTVCCSLPFPEVYIQVVTDVDTGKQTYVVVDGQQRITSILMFIDGEYALPVNDDWDGEYFKDLDPEQKGAFWDYKVVIRYLRKTNEAEIRSVFAKLNTNNVVLNDQELRNARFTGRFKQLSERLADNPIFQKVNLFTPRDVRRMLDIEFVSELLLRLMFGPTNKKDLLESTYVNYDEEFPTEFESEEEFNIALTLVRSLINNETKANFKSKSNFYSLFGICIDYYRATDKTTFTKPDELASALSDLISKARASEFDDSAPEIEDYSNAVSRAASDKSRRVHREKILFNILKTIEDI